MAFFNGIGSAAKTGFGNILRAREARVTRDVHAFLAQMDDDRLNSAGINRNQLEKGGVASNLF